MRSITTPTADGPARLTGTSTLPAPAARRKLIAVSEIFYTVQGEGALVGRPTVFVRTGGCDYQHCSWCDTLYAVLPEYRKDWRPLLPEDILGEVQRLSPRPLLITLSGGNPAMQPLSPLIDLGHAAGYTFCMETQGSIAQSWFAKLEYLTLSPKPPSSGMKTNWPRLDRCVETTFLERHCTTVLKVVVFDDADYAYAQEVHRRYPHLPLYLQAGNATPPHVGAFDLEGVLSKTRWLIDKVLQDQWTDCTVLPQVHALLWGNTRGT